MKTKNQKKYVYEGFGFSVELSSVLMVHINGEWLPQIDVRKLASKVILAIPLQEERLTGYQVKFIRDYFAMSLREFSSSVVHVSHMAVSKWEKFKNKPTNMDVNIETLLRLYIFEKLIIKTEKSKKDFFDLYLSIRGLPYSESSPYLVLKRAA